jgi:hypothetical protein
MTPVVKDRRGISPDHSHHSGCSIAEFRRCGSARMPPAFGSSTAPSREIVRLTVLESNDAASCRQDDERGICENVIVQLGTVENDDEVSTSPAQPISAR